MVYGNFEPLDLDENESMLLIDEGDGNEAFNLVHDSTLIESDQQSKSSVDRVSLSCGIDKVWNY